MINIVLNYVLIFGKFGFPALGITGAAWGTLISRIVMVFLIWYFFRTETKTKLLVSHMNFKILEKVRLKRILALGFPSALQMLFEAGIFTATIWLSGVLGKNAQAANQIALNLTSMTFMVAMGLSVASMVRVGNQKGLQNYTELKRIALSIFLLTLLIEIIFALGFILTNDFFAYALFRYKRINITS